MVVVENFGALGCRRYEAKNDEACSMGKCWVHEVNPSFKLTHPRKAGMGDSSAISKIVGMISSSSRKCRPRSPAPMWPYITHQNRRMMCFGQKYFTTAHRILFSFMMISTSSHSWICCRINWANSVKWPFSCRTWQPSSVFAISP